jgi:hypothetical protein
VPSSPTVRHAIDVAASPEACWKVLTDFNTWPRWFPRAKYAAVLGSDVDPWRVGGRFEIVFDFGLSVSVKPTVEEIQRARHVRWVGKGWGITGDHAYTIETHAGGLTRVTSSESFSGLGARLMTRAILDRLDGEVHRSMSRFKEIVESK